MKLISTLSSAANSSSKGMSVTGGRPGPRPPVEFERRKAARSADCKETAVNN